MDILITGGAGFIGSNLSQYLLDKGHKITIIDNLITGSEKNIEHYLKNKNFRFINKDVLDFNFDDLKTFDIVYHLASPASPIQYKKYPVETLMVNSYGTKRVLDFVLKSKSKAFVLSSTSEIYGDPLSHPQKEDYFGNVNSVGVRACYDEAKRFAEALTMTYYKKYQINVRIARIFNTFGPNMEKNDGRAVSNFVMQALTNSPFTIYCSGNQTRSFCYVSDMIDGLTLLATKKGLDGQIINLGDPNEMKIIDLAHTIKNLVKSSSEIVFKDNHDLDDPKKRRPDITKASNLLGWKTKVSLEDGLKKTIEYFEKHYL